MADISEGIQFRRDGVDPSQWPKLSCSAANQLALEFGSLTLEGNREISFQGNGQLRVNADLRLTVTGNVGINTIADPTAKLEVNGNLKLQQGVAVNEFSNDGNLTDNSDLTIPTEKAVKTYVDTIITQVKTALSTKAALNGVATQDFQTKNLSVAGNLEVTGTTTFRNIEQHQGDLELGNEDTDQMRIHGVVRSTHTSGTLQVESPLQVTGKITADANWTGEEGALTLTGDRPTIRFTGGAMSGNQSWILHLGGNGPGNLEVYRRTGASSWAIIMSLAASGNVGIGTAFPSLSLDVRGNNGWIGSGDSSQTVGGWRLGRWPAYQANTWVYLSRADQTAYQDLAVGALWAGGAMRFGTADDVAEMTPTKETDQLEPGDVVIIDHPPDNRVLLAKSEKPYDSRVAGVISDPDTAGLMIGGSHPQDHDRVDIKPLALCGRVLTKVSTENGNIQPGDCLTAASTSGHAMKSTKPGYILGKAMQSFNGTVTGQPVGKIWVLVNLGWVGHHSISS